MSRVDAAVPCAGPRAGRALRCCAVWCAVTSLTLAVLWLATPALLAIPDLAGRPEAVTFEQVLVDSFAVVATLAALWWWWVASVVAQAAARGAIGGLRGVPAPVRRLVLTWCGVTLAGGVAAGMAGGVTPALAATAEPATSRPAALLQLSGLPLPERATASPSATRVRTVMVRPGDSLWRVADRALASNAAAADIAAFARQIHRLNHHVIGADPDLIRPYQRLRLPHR